MAPKKAKINNDEAQAVEKDVNDIDIKGKVEVVSKNEPLVASMVKNITETISRINNEMKSLVSFQKHFEKEFLKYQKLKNKGQKKPNLRPPSGFAKPTLLSDELCNFLNLPSKTMLARTDVTRKLNAYIKENNLQRPDNKKFIVPDAKLTELLNLKDSDELSYFNLQRYMKHLFV